MSRRIRNPFTPGMAPPHQQNPLLRVVFGLLLSILIAVPLSAAPPERAFGGAWQDQGPGPASNGQVENVGKDDQVVGAVHVVVAHPSDADTLWIGATNGGLWKTTNATAASPNWINTSDDKGSLSISALALDPTDGTNQTLLAGVGGYSSYGRNGDRIGLLRSTDGGATWTLIDGGGTLTGKNISGVAPRGATIVVSVNVGDGDRGIFRSTDTGASFAPISSGDGSTTGLPGGRSHDLLSDPSDNAILYTSMIDADDFGGVSGVYKSTDTGATWTKVSSAAMDTQLTGNVSNVEFAIGPTGTNVYAAIVKFGRLAGVLPFRQRWWRLDRHGYPRNHRRRRFRPRHPPGWPRRHPLVSRRGSHGHGGRLFGWRSSALFR